MNTLHVLVQDNDCHWYCIPTEHAGTFDAMMNCDPDEITDEGYDFLDEHRVDGPHAVEFYWPAKPDVVHRIVDILNGKPEWSSDTLGDIAALLNENGYKIHELDEESINVS